MTTDHGTSGFESAHEASPTALVLDHVQLHGLKPAPGEPDPRPLPDPTGPPRLPSGSAWRPRAGSLVNHKHLTAALIDSRDFISAGRRTDTELLVPKGTRIAFSGGTDCADHTRIWSVLDAVRAKHPDMVLLHGGTPKGAERAAACWADSRGVTQIAFKPDWTRDGKAAPFKRNDRMLETLPKGVIVFPGSGITGNLADKAKKLGIPVLDHRGGA